MTLVDWNHTPVLRLLKQASANPLGVIHSLMELEGGGQSWPAISRLILALVFLGRELKADRGLMLKTGINTCHSCLVSPRTHLGRPLVLGLRASLLCFYLSANWGLGKQFFGRQMDRRKLGLLEYIDHRGSGYQGIRFLHTGLAKT